MLHVSVIDDDALVLSMMRRSLNLFGFVVDCHSSAAAFFWHLDPEHLPDLIFCDVMMPQVDGLELYNRLYTLVGSRMPPFVFTTGHPPSERLKSLLGNPEVQILGKPFQLSQLRDLVHAKMQTIRPARGDGLFGDETMRMDFE